MKKLNIMLVIILFVLGACNTVEVVEDISDEERAVVMYTQAATKMEQLQNVEIHRLTDVMVTVETQTFSVPMLSLTKINKDDNDLQFSTIISMPMDNEQVTTIAYYRDGFLYSSVGELRTKTPFSTEEALESMQITRLLNFEADAIKEVSIIDTDEGYELTFLLDPNSIEEELQNLTYYLQNIVYPLMFISFTDVSFQVNIDNNGNIKLEHIEFRIDIEREGIRGTIIFEILNEVLGETVIVFPEDLEEYQLFLN